MHPHAATLAERIPEMLAFEAPYVERAMLEGRVAASRDEARDLLREVLKYLVVCRAVPTARVPMFSRRVDEAWHQHALFTERYAEITARLFGEYVHHAPNQSPDAPLDPRPEMTLADFADAYRPLFGALSPLWDDARSITPRTRVMRARYRRPMSARVVEQHAELVLAREPPYVLVRAAAHAAEALAFVAAHEVFHVRELTGLEDDERVALCRELVTRGFLTVAP
jgi:hypothetical protein